MKLQKLILVITYVLLVFTGQKALAADDYQIVMQQLIARGDAVTSQYQPQEAIKYSNAYSELYFGGFEGKGLEFAVGQADQDAMLRIELGFSRLINAAVKGHPDILVQQRWLELRELLEEAPMIEHANSSFWEVVVQSLLILLREGVEALLVIAALMAYLRKAGAADKVLYIWLGSITALIASVLTAWGLQNLIASSGAARETLEGVTMLVAALLLSYVSAWLYARKEMKQWQGFIDNQIGAAVKKGSLYAIVSVAFFAVYREGAETILFYQALISNAEDAFDAISLGFGLAAIGLLGLYFLIFQLSVRLPLKQFFTGTAVLLYGLSVVFTGKAVLELQVSGWIGNTWLAFMPTVSWLGVFPSVESLAAQISIALLPVIGYVLFIRSKSISTVNK